MGTFKKILVSCIKLKMLLFRQSHPASFLDRTELPDHRCLVPLLRSNGSWWFHKETASQDQEGTGAGAVGQGAPQHRVPPAPKPGEPSSSVAVAGSVTACRLPDKPLVARLVWGHTRRSNVQGQDGPRPPGHSGKDQGEGLSPNALPGWCTEGA